MSAPKLFIPPGADAKPAAPDGASPAPVEIVCPFSLNVVYAPGASGAAKAQVVGGKIVERVEMVPNTIHLQCYQAKCALWVAEHAACAIKVSALAASGLLPARAAVAAAAGAA